LTRNKNDVTKSSEKKKEGTFESNNTKTSSKEPSDDNKSSHSSQSNKSQKLTNAIDKAIAAGELKLAKQKMQDHKKIILKAQSGA